MSEGFNRKYPKGRISGDDDGELTYGIGTDTEHKIVILNFFKPVGWLGYDFDSGLRLLMSFAKALSKISGKVISVTVEDYQEKCPPQGASPIF